MKGQKADFIYGTDYVKPNQTEVFTFNDKRVGGMTPGRKSCIKKKVDGNEDAMAVVPINQQVDLLLLADSHFGAMPARYSVDRFKRVFDEMKGSNPRRLFFTHLILDNEIRNEKHGITGISQGAATTLISLALKGDTAAYCTSGDSLFYILRGGLLQEVTETNDSLFLGDFNKPIRRFMRTLMKAEIIDSITYDDNAKIRDILFQLTKIHKQVKANRVDLPSVEQIITDIASTAGLPFPIPAEEIAKEWHPLNLEMGQLLPSWGSITIKEGDILFLATDGIEEITSGLKVEDLQDILADRNASLAQRAETILDRSLGKRGGDDNISFIIQEI